VGPDDTIYYNCVLSREIDAAVLQAVLQAWASTLGLTHTPTLTFDHGAHEAPLVGTRRDDLYAWPTDGNVAYVVIHEDAVRRLDGESLASLLFGLGVDLRLVLGRAIREGFHMSVHPEEVTPDGALTGLGWFQYFGPAIAGRWPDEVWQPFRTMRGSDGAVGLILGDDPLRPRIREAATALGLAIRPLYGRNPATGERIVIPHL
jgi:hypothetical protein